MLKRWNFVYMRDILKLCICWLGEGGEVEKKESISTSPLGCLSKVTVKFNAEKHGEMLALEWVGQRACDLGSPCP